MRGNPNLRPEHALNWETGLEYRGLGKTLTARATYFHQRFRDLIQYSGTPVGPDSVNYSNVADAAAQGAELGVQGALAGGLAFDASYTYLDSRDFATNLRLQRRPSHTASLGLGYGVGARGTASLVAVYTGDRDDYDYSTFPARRVTLPPHTRVDASSTYELSRARGTLPGLAITARLEDLLGARYEDVKNFPARGRTLLLGGRLDWGW